MDEREAKLPAWAHEILADLRNRLKWQSEPLVKELASLRPKVERLQSENGAIRELLEAAARGGHLASAAIVEILNIYEIARPTHAATGTDPAPPPSV